MAHTLSNKGKEVEAAKKLSQQRRRWSHSPEGNGKAKPAGFWDWQDQEDAEKAFSQALTQVVRKELQDGFESLANLLEARLDCLGSELENHLERLAPPATLGISKLPKGDNSPLEPPLARAPPASAVTVLMHQVGRQSLWRSLASPDKKFGPRLPEQKPSAALPCNGIASSPPPEVLRLHATWEVPQPVEDEPSLPRQVSPDYSDQSHKLYPETYDSECGMKKRRTIQSVQVLSKESRDSTMSLRRSSLESPLQNFVIMYHKARKRSRFIRNLWQFLEDPDVMPGGRLFMNITGLAITISGGIPVVQTMEQNPLNEAYIDPLQMFLDSLFLLEVGVRFFACPNRLAFFLSAYNWVDVIAGVVPFTVRIVMSNELLVQAEKEGKLWLLCLVSAVPILRLLKLLRRFETFHLITKAVGQALPALPVLFYTLTLLVLLFSYMIYIVEPRDNIQSMSQALWLSIVTVGTIGYGDIVPQSAIGAVIVSALIVVSALYMAIPIGIIGKVFGDIWDDREKHLLMHRTRSRFLTTGYGPFDIPAMFNNFDTNQDGQLSLHEFMEMMKALEIVIDDVRVTELFKYFDSDHNGSIDQKEFVRSLFPDAYGKVYGGQVDDYGVHADEQTLDTAE